MCTHGSNDKLCKWYLFLTDAMKNRGREGERPAHGAEEGPSTPDWDSRSVTASDSSAGGTDDEVEVEQVQADATAMAEIAEAEAEAEAIEAAAAAEERQKKAAAEKGHLQERITKAKRDDAEEDQNQVAEAAAVGPAPSRDTAPPLVQWVPDPTRSTTPHVQWVPDQMRSVGPSPETKAERTSQSASARTAYLVD